ncbi:MAG: hypothetical protein WBM40_23305 [Thiohalocapsa sp.]
MLLTREFMVAPTSLHCSDPKLAQPVIRDDQAVTADRGLIA